MTRGPVAMSDTLLRHRIQTLRLDRTSPFPSEVQDGHDFVRKWRLEQRLKLVRRDGDLRDRDSDDTAVDPVDGGEAA